MAIARYGSLDGGGTNGTSHTFAVDVGSGSNRYLLVFAKVYGDITGLAATYAGSSMGSPLATIAVEVETTSTLVVFGLANPASGSNNVVVTRTPTSSHIVASALAYTGVSSTIEGVVTANGPSGGVLTISVTITNTGCWLVGGFGGNFSGNAYQDTAAAGDGTFIDDNGYAGLNGLLGIYDSNGTVGTGSQSIAGYRGQVVDSFSGIAVGLAPSGAAPTGTSHDLPLLGVGKGLLPFWPAWWRYQRMREKRIRQAERDCLRRHAA